MDRRCRAPIHPQSNHIELTFASISPSMYLEFVGTIGVSDYCGAIESPLTSQLISFAPGALSTYEAPYSSIGDQHLDPLSKIKHGGTAQEFPSPKPLSIQDLECPTFGVGISTHPGRTTVTTIGPPWLPLISPPPEILTLNSDWDRICRGFSLSINK